MSQKIRQEINLQDAITPSTASNFTGTSLSLMDTSNYSGTPTYYFEAVFNGAAGNTGTINLRDVTGSTNIVTLAGATGTSWSIARTAFTPTAGARQYTYGGTGDSVHTQSVVASRIIVLQDETAITATETQIEIGSSTEASPQSNTTVADITNPKFWKYTAANWDGTKAFAVEVVWITSAKNTTTITLCRTSDNAANVTVVSAGTGTFTRTRVAFTPVDGETYKLRGVGSTTKSTYSVICAKIIVTQTVSVTKCEPQFLLLNTADSNATGLQNYLTTWNSTEFDVGTGTISYEHAMDSNNASNSIILRNVTDSDDVTSTVTGSEQQVSSAMTVGAGELVTAKNYDCWVLNTTGIIASSRIIVVYAFVAAAAITLIELITEPLTPARWKGR